MGVGVSELFVIAMLVILFFGVGPLIGYFLGYSVGRKRGSAEAGTRTDGTSLPESTTSEIDDASATQSEEEST